MIISTNVGGLSNRIKSLVSCIRYSHEYNMEVGVYWLVLDSYQKNLHLRLSFKLLYNSVILTNL